MPALDQHSLSAGLFLSLIRSLASLNYILNPPHLERLPKVLIVSFFFVVVKHISFCFINACGSPGKESSCNEGDLDSIPVLGRSPGEGKGYPLQYTGLEDSMDCIVHGVAKCWTQLNGFHVTAHQLFSSLSNIFSL